MGKTNEGFGPCIREGLVTRGAGGSGDGDMDSDLEGVIRAAGQTSSDRSVPAQWEDRGKVSAGDRKETAYHAARQAYHGHYKSGHSHSTQSANWVTRVHVGDIIVMRHIYESDKKHMPQILDISSNGDAFKYRGGVYVLARVTAVPMVGYSKNKDFYSRLPELAKYYRADGGCYAKVKPLRMGLIENLDKKTTSYISVICQPTLARMAKFDPNHTVYTRRKNPLTYAEEGKMFKQDLLRHATIDIGDHSETFKCIDQ